MLTCEYKIPVTLPAYDTKYQDLDLHTRYDHYDLQLAQQHHHPGGGGVGASLSQTNCRGLLFVKVQQTQAGVENDHGEERAGPHLEVRQTVAASL